MGSSLMSVIAFVKAALPFIIVGVVLAILAAKKGRHIDDKNKEDKNYSSEGMAIGMCLGLAVGVALGDYLAYGLALGMFIGLAVGSLIKKEDE